MAERIIEDYEDDPEYRALQLEALYPVDPLVTHELRELFREMVTAYAETVVSAPGQRQIVQWQDRFLRLLENL